MPTPFATELAVPPYLQIRKPFFFAAHTGLPARQIEQPPSSFRFEFLELESWRRGGEELGGRLCRPGGVELAGDRGHQSLHVCRRGRVEGFGDDQDGSRL